MKFPDLGIDSYLLNGASKPIRDFFTKVAESDLGFKHENPDYYAENKKKLEELHQPFLPQQHEDIYQLKFPALTQRVLDFKEKPAKDFDSSFSNIIDGFKELNLLAHRYQQLKDKNEETNFGLFGKNASFATSRSLDQFFTESFSQIQSTLIKALPDSGKYDITLLKNLALENQQYPQKSKKWQQEFLSAAKLISIGERLVKDYKNPNNTDDERTIRFQSLVLLSERLNLFSQKNATHERLFGSESPLLSLFAKQHKQLNDFWDKQLTPILDQHMRSLTAQDNSVLKLNSEDEAAELSKTVKSENNVDLDPFKKVKGLFNQVAAFIEDHTKLKEPGILKEAIDTFEEVTKHLKALLEIKTANLKEV